MTGSYTHISALLSAAYGVQIILMILKEMINYFIKKTHVIVKPIDSLL